MKFFLLSMAILMMPLVHGRPVHGSEKSDYKLLSADGKEYGIDKKEDYLAFKDTYMTVFNMFNDLGQNNEMDKLCPVNNVMYDSMEALVDYAIEYSALYNTLGEHPSFKEPAEFVPKPYGPNDNEEAKKKIDEENTAAKKSFDEAETKRKDIITKFKPPVNNFIAKYLIGEPTSKDSDELLEKKFNLAAAYIMAANFLDNSNLLEGLAQYLSKHIEAVRTRAEEKVKHEKSALSEDQVKEEAAKIWSKTINLLYVGEDEIIEAEKPTQKTQTTSSDQKGGSSNSSNNSSLMR